MPTAFGGARRAMAVTSWLEEPSGCRSSVGSRTCSNHRLLEHRDGDLRAADVHADESLSHGEVLSDSA